MADWLLIDVVDCTHIRYSRNYEGGRNKEGILRRTVVGHIYEKVNIGQSLQEGDWGCRNEYFR